MIVILHGGPHNVSLSSFSKNSGFLASIGYSLLIVNYRQVCCFQIISNIIGLAGFISSIFLVLYGSINNNVLAEVHLDLVRRHCNHFWARSEHRCQLLLLFF